MKITFLGAAEEVTGSRNLVQDDDTMFLVDCGLFQGDKELRKKNWDPFPVDPSAIDAIVLSHAHIDHTGYIPLLVRNGFRGKIYCSPATFELCKIMLVDSAVIQEDNARKKRLGKPLYTIKDAEHSFEYFSTVAYDTPITIGKNFQVTLVQSGHILGSSFVVVSDGKRVVTFSGDLGRPDQVIMKSPPHIKTTDYLILESTYGNRLHTEGDPIKTLGEMVNETIKKGGVVIIPAFAVGRTQAILYCLYKLIEDKIVPKVPLFLDSPMAISVTNLFCAFNDEHTLSDTMCSSVFDMPIYTRTTRESKKLDHLNGPAVILAGSGMADGGRIDDHFKRYISNAKNTVIFVGFQAPGTEGRRLVDGVKKIVIEGKSYAVRASIRKINTLSAHADYNEILEWLAGFKNAPKKVFLNHGEKEAAQSLQEKIKERFAWNVIIPKYHETFTLD